MADLVTNDAPSLPVRIDGANVTGEGWTVTVATGWIVRSGPRSGDYQIIRDPQ